MRFIGIALSWVSTATAVTDAAIGLAYATVFTCLLITGRRMRHIPEIRSYSWIPFSIGAFLGARGITLIMDLVATWWPLLQFAVVIKMVCAAISIPAAIYFARKTPLIVPGIQRSLLALLAAERSLDANIASYTSQMEAINRSQMMTEFDMAGNILRVNGNFLRRFGYQEDELLGKHCSVLISQQYWQSEDFKRFWTELGQGIAQSGQYERLAKDGQVVWIEAGYNPIFDAEGKPVRVVGVVSDLTERVKIQTELKDAEARLQTIVNNVMAGIIMIDGAGTILSMNPAALRMFDYEVAAVLGQNIKVLMPEEDRWNHDGYLAQYESKDGARVIGLGRELEGLTRAGDTFPMELTVTEAPLQGKRLFVGLIRDISERRRTEKERNRQDSALRKSEDLLDRTGRLASVGGWEVDLVSRAVYWSDETARLHGMEPGYQPTLEEGFNFYAPEARDRISAAVNKAMLDGEPWEMEAPVNRVDGRKIWVRVVASVEFGDGKPIRLVGAFQDVTARVEERLALREANERTALATESAGIGIWDWDLKTNQLVWDPWMYRLYGIAPGNASLDFGFWTSHVHADDFSLMEDSLNEGLAGTKPYDAEFRIVWDDGTIRHVKGTGKVTRDDAGTPTRMVGTNFDITARKEAEEKLRQSTEKEQLLMRGVKDYAILMLDLDGNVATWNEGAESIHGYRSDEILGRPFSTFYTPEARAQGISEHGLAMARQAGRFEEEGWRVRKDGSRFWASIVITPLEDEAGQPRGFGKITRDITERKQAEDLRARQERALRKSEELLDRTGKVAGVGGWEIDLLTGASHWSAETARIHGLEAHAPPSLEEQINYYAPEAQPVVRAAVEKAMKEGQGWELEVPLVRADGRQIWVRIIGSVESKAGTPVRLFGAIQDVTTRKLAEEGMRNRGDLLDLSHDTILVRDKSGRIAFWNQGAVEMYGYSKQEAFGSSSHELMQTVFPRPLAEIEEELVRTGRWEGELIHTTKDGRRIIVSSRWALQLRKDGSEPALMEVNNDITERKAAEEVSRLARVEAEKANHAKSDFLANMSHEIRTPMNAIMGMTHLALRANPAPEQQKYLTKIASAADSLLSIINDILDFSKMEAGKMDLEEIPFPLTDILTNVADIVAHTAKRKEIGLSFLVEPEVAPFLLGDPLRLKQVLINLVNNGIKFTQVGRVAVSITAVPVAERKTRLTFFVRDTGIGMSPEQVTNLFKSFNQADPSFTRKYGGTGLGLAIARQICDLMGGTLTVESELGTGSTFIFSATFGIAEASPALLRQGETFDARRRSLLIVDDNQGARDVLSAMLDANGFAAKTVASGEEAISALSLASEADEPFDLVLMDWRMPGINGVEAARQIKARIHWQHIPSILMVSAFEREEVMKNVADPGLGGFLIKPVKESLLIDTIADILGTAPGFQTVIPREKSLTASSEVVTELKGRRVLLVEDNEINRDLAAELLTDLGIIVSLAVNGLEGVERVMAESFDLVLMDIQMPVMDGITAVRRIRSEERFQRLPIIAMTALAMSGDREQSLQAGMNDHLTKPINPSKLTRTLLQWMPGKRKLPQQSLGGEGNGLPDPEALPEFLWPFDLRAALARTNGKPRLLRKMMLGFCRQFAHAGTEVRRLLEAGKDDACETEERSGSALDIRAACLADAQRLAHSLKGAALTLEAHDLAAAAAAIEEALRFRPEEDLSSLLNAMEEALTPAIAAAASLDRRSAVASIAGGMQRQHELRSTRKAGHCILIVDDESTYVDLLIDTFGDRYEVLYEGDGVAALATSRAHMPDVILLDVMMPGIDGYEVCRRLKAEPETAEIPVIFLTSLGDVADESKALAMGAVDYVTKPINPAAVRARVQNHIKLKHAHDELMRLAEEKHAAELIKELEHAAEVERMNRKELQLRDDFLSHVSHELRSPLTAIYSFSSIIADGLAGETSKEQNEYLDIILKNVHQLKSMIEDLLSIGAAKTGKLSVQPERLVIAGTVGDAVHTLQGAAAAKNIHLTWNVEEGVKDAFADPVRLLQILIVLGDNAIKFTPTGGAITFHGGCYQEDPQFLLLSVTDTGCGIKPENRERVFEHLYQITGTSQAGRNGLGLGLHIAKELVTLQGGTIWVDSTPHAGSRFCFTVPMFAEQKASEQRGSLLSASRPGCDS